MKKLISLFLAILMVFSVATVAFAEGDVQDPPAASENQDAQPVGNNEGTPADAQPAEEQKPAEEEKKDESADVKELIDKFQNLPSSTRHSLFIIGKIALKFVKIFAKLGFKFGLIDANSVVNSVAEAFGLDPETELPAGTAEAIRTLI